MRAAFAAQNPEAGTLDSQQARDAAALLHRQHFGDDLLSWEMSEQSMETNPDEWTADAFVRWWEQGGKLSASERLRREWAASELGGKVDALLKLGER